MSTAALVCPACASNGVLVAGYGREMPVELADAVALLPGAGT